MSERNDSGRDPLLLAHLHSIAHYRVQTMPHSTDIHFIALGLQLGLEIPFSPVKVVDRFAGIGVPGDVQQKSTKQDEIVISMSCTIHLVIIAFLYI